MLHDLTHISRRAVALLFATALFCVSAVARGGDEFPAELTRFQPYGKNPVFAGAGGTAWDAKIRERGWIIRDGDGWRMWYTGYQDVEKPQMMLGLATSRDGLT